MPAFTATTTLTNPASQLTDGTKYIVQVKGDFPVNFAKAAAAFTAATTDCVTLGPITGRNSHMPTHMEYTYATAHHIRFWTDSGESAIVFHSIE